jgi:hypothetical protein
MCVKMDAFWIFVGLQKSFASPIDPPLRNLVANDNLLGSSFKVVYIKHVIRICKFFVQVIVRSKRNRATGVNCDLEDESYVPIIYWID